ncbi:MAG: hypothetical protein NWF14_01355 [Candidatus Bathyarchaeota archaeon]|nr:hypothetical protein [Candidatus Bathyarchaeota archaeon]
MKRSVKCLHLAVCALSTAACTILAIWAVVVAPVPPAPGVSGLYIAAAVYVPLELWFGVWGSIAGYLSCVLMGLYFGYSVTFALVWSLADFFEGFVPLLAYRTLKIEPSFRLEKPKVTYLLTALLVVNIVVSGAATVLTLTEIFVATFIFAIAILVLLAIVENLKDWVMWTVFGVIVASIVFGVFGVGTLTGFGIVPLNAFPVVFFGWVFGDTIVLSTIGTAMMVSLTPLVRRTSVYVKGFFS